MSLTLHGLGLAPGASRAFMPIACIRGFTAMQAYGGNHPGCANRFSM